MYRRNRRKSGGIFILQLTSMVDMFTIILVFLLKSYSTSAVQVTPSDNINLPTSVSQTDPIEGLKVAVTENSVSVEDKVVFLWAENKASKSKNSKLVVKKLLLELQEQAEKSKKISKVNNSIKFEGKLVLQVDRAVPYRIIKKVMATASIAGYRDFRLLTITD